MIARPGLGRGDRLFRDLLRRDRQVVDMDGRVDRAGDGAGDDDLGHGRFLRDGRDPAEGGRVPEGGVTGGARIP
jgi:hypothetical protein